MLKEPKAKKIDTILTSHGHDRIDSYYWMSERDNPDVLNYLHQENDYRNNFMSDYKNLEIKFSELKTESKMMIPVCHIMIMVISIIRDLKKKNSIPFTVGKKI